MTDLPTAFQQGAQAISKAYGVPVNQVLSDLAAEWNRQAGFAGHRGGYGDLSTTSPDTATSGLFGIPAVALYSAGAVLLGIGLFVAFKKK